MPDALYDVVAPCFNFVSMNIAQRGRIDLQRNQIERVPLPGLRDVAEYGVDDAPGILPILDAGSVVE